MMQQHEGLADLFVDTLRDIYSAEKQILRSLPKLARAADADALREAFLTHRDQTEDQIGRLDQVFELIGEKPGRKTCEAMQGILEEGDETMADYAGSDALDAGLIAAGQAVEHYEISRYTALRDWASALGMSKAASLLAETLDEEKETDRVLSEIAESSANETAMAGAAPSTAGTRTVGVKGTDTASSSKDAAKASARQGTGIKASAGAASSGTAPKAAPAKGETAGAAGRPDARTRATGMRAQPAALATGRSQRTTSTAPVKGTSPGSPTAAAKPGAGSAAVSAGTASGEGGMQSGGSQKSPGTLGGRTAGDDEVPSAMRSTPRSG